MAIFDDTDGDDLLAYYDRRAQALEATYTRSASAIPEGLVADLRELGARRRVLELASGTGFWTVIVADVAELVVGCDVSPNMLAVARAKSYRRGNASFQQVSAYDLTKLKGHFEASFAMQWFSHVPRERCSTFLENWHARVGRGARVLVADNLLTERWRRVTHRKAGTPDTYQLREFSDGSSILVLKNFYEEDELRLTFSAHAADLHIQRTDRWWWVCYTVP